MATYPNVDQASLDAMALHDVLIYPANNGGDVWYQGVITRVSTGWLYGHEFVPETLCCTGSDSFFFYDQTGSDAPIAPSTPTTLPSVVADGALVIEQWDNLARYWTYDASGPTWTLAYDNVSSGINSVSTDATITGNGTPGSPLSVDKTGDWTGTFDGQEGSYYLDYTNLSNKPTIPTASDLPFGIGWNVNTDVPTKNAVYDKLISLTAADITDFDTEVSNNVDVAANTTARHTHANKALLDTYTQTEADLADAVVKKHDAVTVLDSAEIDFTLVGQQITGSLKAGSIDETKLDVSVNASLDLADSALQNVVEDLTPQLGGDLDAQNNEITNIDGLSFNTTPVTTGGSAQIWWNPDEETFNMGVNGDVTLQVGQEMLVYYKADENISNGQVVMYTGAVGASGKPTGALSTGSAPIVMGIATEDVTVGNFGFLTWFGKVQGIQTNGANYGEVWSDGDALYNNPSVSGGLTNVQPTAPDHAIVVAYVIKAHATTGTLFVSINQGAHLDGLHDVDTGGKSAGDSIVWDSVSGTWVSQKICDANLCVDLSSYTGLDGRYYTETELDSGQLDTRYFTESEHISSSAGVADAGKPIILNASGVIDTSMYTPGVTDHGALTGLADDDHTQYHNDTRGDARYYTKTLLDGGQLDNRYYTETEVDALTWDASDIISGTFADARISESSVTQHKNAIRKIEAFNTVATTTYTLVLGDAYDQINFTNASGCAITIPPNSSVAFDVGTIIDLCQRASGDVGRINVSPGSGVTIVNSSINSSNEQYDVIQIRKEATDTWLVVGGINPSV